MKQLKLFFALFAMLALGVGNAWGADSGITASDGVFVIDFYNSDKLTSTSGSDLTTTNYSNYVKVASGLTKSNVVTSISKDGTVQYNKNGGLTIGSSKANAHYVTFNIGSDYAVNKVTVYATKYETGRFFLNGKAADSGALGDKGATFSKVTQPLVWDNLNGVTTLKFTKDNGSGSNQKRLTIYTIVCEYATTSGGDEPGSEETVVSLLPKNTIFEVLSSGYLQRIFGVSSAYLLRIFCCENCPAKPSLTTRLPLATSSHSPNTYPIPHKYRHLRGGIVVVTMDPRHLLFCVNEPKKINSHLIAQ